LFRSGEIISLQGKLWSLRRWLVFALTATLVVFSCALFLAVEDAQAKGNSPSGGSGQGQGGDASGGGDAKQAKGDASGGGDAKQAKGDAKQAKGDAGAAPGGGDAKQTTGDALRGATNQAKDDAPRLDTDPVRQGASEPVTQTAAPALKQTGDKVEGVDKPETGTTSEAAAPTLGQEEKGSGGLTKPAGEATKPLVEGGVAPTLKEATQPLQPALETATQPLQPVLETATQPLQPVLETATQPLQPALETATQPLQPVLETATQPLQPVLETATQPLQPVLETATQPLQPVLETATQPLQPVLETTSSLVKPIEGATSPILESVVKPVFSIADPFVQPVLGALAPAIKPALEEVAPVLGSTSFEGVAPSLTEPSLEEATPGMEPSFKAMEPAPGVALEQPVAAAAFETGLGAGDILSGDEPNTSALGIETPLPPTTTSPYPVLRVVEGTGLLDPRAAAALDTARDAVEATVSYRPVVVASEPQSTVTTTKTSSSSRSFSGMHPRLFDSSLGAGYLRELGGAAAAAATKFSQNDRRAPSPLSPFGGLPFGALPASSFFSGVGTGLGLGLLAILALLPLLVHAGRLSRPSREVFKLVSSSSLITERPG
jgi:hypothetical protein